MHSSGSFKGIEIHGVFVAIQNFNARICWVGWQKPTLTLWACIHHIHQHWGILEDNTKPNRSVWNFWGMKDWKCPWLNDECQNQCISKGIGDVHCASHDNLRVVFQGTWAIGLQELAFCASPRNVDIPPLNPPHSIAATSCFPTT